MQTFISNSTEETEKFASQFAKKLKKGDILSLSGELGSGKTAFVRGLFEGMGGDPNYFVTSPTFTLMHEYPTQKAPLYHFDLYRLNSLQELENLDFQDYFEGKGICVVEWGDKIKEIKGLFNYWFDFQVVDSFTRKIIFKLS